MALRKAPFISLIRGYTVLFCKNLITVKFLSFTFAICVSNTLNMRVPDKIINITSLHHLLFAVLCVGSMLLELFSKKVRVKKHPEMSLIS